MPRHPPIALKTLDRSHCRCPLGRSPTRLAYKKDQLLEICSMARLGKPIICRGLSVPCDGPTSSTPDQLRRALWTPQGRAPTVEPEQIFSLQCHAEQASDRSPQQTFFLKRMTTLSSPDLIREMVEPDGIEPTTPCLQSRCSPS